MTGKGDDNAYSPVGRLSSESGAGFLSGSLRERPLRQPFWAGRRATVILAAALLVSNSIWAGVFSGYNLALKRTPSSPAMDPLDHTDHDQLSTAFHWNTPFSDDNKTISNPLWHGLFPRTNPPSPSFILSWVFIFFFLKKRLQ